MPAGRNSDFPAEVQALAAPIEGALAGKRQAARRTACAVG